MIPKNTASKLCPHGRGCEICDLVLETVQNAQIESSAIKSDSVDYYFTGRPWNKELKIKCSQTISLLGSDCNRFSNTFDCESTGTHLNNLCPKDMNDFFVGRIQDLHHANDPLKSIHPALTNQHVRNTEQWPHISIAITSLMWIVRINCCLFASEVFVISSVVLKLCFNATCLKRPYNESISRHIWPNSHANLHLQD